MTRHLAAEDRVLLAHPRLEERVADAVHECPSARPLDDVGDRAAGAHVVQDRRLWLLVEHRLGQQRGHEVPVDECALLVDEEAAVGVAVPGDPEVGALVDDLAHDELPVLGQQRVGLVIGEVAVGLEIGLDEVEPEPLQDRSDHRARHPVAAVDDDLERLDHAGVDELQRGLLELVPDRDVLHAASARGIAQAFLDLRLDVADSGVARQCDRPALDELGARIPLRVVRGGAHQPAVEAARADQVIEHLGADLARVEHVGALAAHALAVGGRHLRRGQAHVAPQPEPQLRCGLVLERGDHPRERASDLLGDLLVEVASVHPADVVGLEDLWVRDRAHRARMLPAGPLIG